MNLKNSTRNLGPLPQLGPLLARLTPVPRLYVQTPSGVEEPPPGRGRRVWLVARSLCRFFKVPLLPDAPRARQLEALGLEIARLSPFAETGSHYYLGRDFAGVWVWDQAAARAAGQAIGLDLTRLRVIPEPAMCPPLGDGVRLIEMVDGYEGQIWDESCLIASRWWRALPDRSSWIAFQRGGSLPPERFSEAVPIPQRLELLPQAWTRTRAAAFNLAQLDMRLVAAGVVAAVAVAYAYQGAQWWRASAEVAGLANEVAQRSAAVEPVLKARTQALDNLAAIRVLHDLDRFPSQLTLMARVVQVLPRADIRFTEWLFDRGQLQLGIAAEQPLDVVKLVRSLEGIEHFKSVAAERTGTNNSLRLRLTVTPL